MEKLYTVKEIAEYFAVSVKTVRRWIAEGRIKAFKVGGAWRMAKKDLGKFNP